MGLLNRNGATQVMESAIMCNQVDDNFEKYFNSQGSVKLIAQSMQS